METVSVKGNYKWCFVPKCPNTSKLRPDLIFVSIPKGAELREKWFFAAKRLGKISATSNVFCCMDHFNTDDFDNWMRCKIMGGPLKLKPGVVPHKYECQRRGIFRKILPAKKKHVHSHILKPGWKVSDLFPDLADAVPEATEPEVIIEEGSPMAPPKMDSNDRPATSDRSTQYRYRPRFRSKKTQCILSSADGPSSLNVKDSATSMSRLVTQNLVQTSRLSGVDEWTCRLCASIQQQPMHDIFNTDDGSENTVAEAMVRVFQLEIMHCDNLPSTVCQACIEQLRSAENFKQCCLLADQTLQERNNAKVHQTAQSTVSEVQHRERKAVKIAPKTTHSVKIQNMRQELIDEGVMDIDEGVMEVDERVTAIEEVIEENDASQETANEEFSGVEDNIEDDEEKSQSHMVQVQDVEEVVEEGDGKKDGKKTRKVTKHKLKLVTISSLHKCDLCKKVFLNKSELGTHSCRHKNNMGNMKILIIPPDEETESGT